MKRITSLLFTIVLVVGILSSMYFVQPVKATETIYIRADGSIDPPTAPVFTVDNTTYSLTDNIVFSAYGIMIQRDNIVLDGAGYSIQGTNQYTGIYLSATTNVTIRNTIITDFATGIYLYYGSSNNIANNFITAIASTGIQLYTSSSNSITENAIINSSRGIDLWFSSNSNIISANNITENSGWGINAWTLSNYTTIVGNNITENGDGILLHNSHYNSILENRIERNRGYGIDSAPSSGSNICRNDIACNNLGISISFSSNNSISENNITNNTQYGACFRLSSYNSICGNTITSNSGLGIYLYESSVYNSISGNTITNNTWGIFQYASSDYNSIDGNTIAHNTQYGVEVIGSSNNLIYHNNITSNSELGIYLSVASNNSVCENSIANNDQGIKLDYSDYNRVFHNSFINNTQQVVSYDSVNVWDDGYPSGGNCWSDYTDADLYNGPNQDLLGSDGIGDTPYVINDDNRDNYPLAKSYGGIHDIGITAITACKTVVGQGYNLNVTIEILNYGINMENFDLTMYVNTTIQTVTNIVLTSRNSTTMTFTWDTAGFVLGNCAVWAYAEPVPDELDTTDNTCTDGIVAVTIPGDVDGDFDVDILDVVKITGIYASRPSDLNFNPNSDINDDGQITILDVVICTSHYGEKYP